MDKVSDSHDQYKITVSHLTRRAIVYLRQSSPGQVKHNTESTRLQYALAQRARRLGWSEIEVIDSDLGSSATLGARRREGFDALIADVARSEVGIVFGWEVSRLSRTDKDWCHLMEVCQVFDTLVGDDERVYDLSLLDDQLVLNIKGTMSVMEYRVLRRRLQQAREKKASRGELTRLLPPGYVYDADGKVAKDPNQRVREAVELVFETHRQTWSIRQTFKWFHDERIELPVNKVCGGSWRLVWQLPTHSFIDDMLRNPWYAGAYVWGRRPTQIVLENDRLERRSAGRCEPEQCRVFIPDNHEGYITWEQYEENRRMRRRNAQQWQDPTAESAVAAVRAGQGLLGGLLRCGRCGRRMRVRYWGKSGTSARYLCVGDYRAGGEYCQAFGGATVDRRFGQELLEALSPLGIESSMEALERFGRGANRRHSALANQLEQLRYEAQRAFEQYDQVDPRNRLVAAGLEQRWNNKLEQVSELEAELARADQSTPTLSPEEREAVLSLGAHFETVWHSADCPAQLKKKIAHTVVEEVIVELDDDTDKLEFVVHWKGGSHTGFEMDKPRSGVGQKTSDEDLEIIRKLAVRYGDAEIARVLTKLGRRTGKGNRWNQHRVKSARSRASIAGRARTVPDPEVLSLYSAAKHCGISDTTITRLVDHGLVTNHQDVPWAPWELKRSDLESEPVRSIIAHLRETGKLVLEGLEGFSSGQQQELFE